MQGVSERALVELAKRVPGLSGDEFSHWVSIYKIEREHSEATPANARDHLDRMSDSAFDLSAAIASAMQDEGVWDFLANECAAYGDFNFAVRLRSDLLRFGGVVENARRQAEKLATAGRPMLPRTRLILSLAGAIERAGMKADARPAGPLVLAFDIAMQDTGETVLDLKGTVRSALAKGKE